MANDFNLQLWNLCGVWRSKSRRRKGGTVVGEPKMSFEIILISVSGSMSVNINESHTESDHICSVCAFMKEKTSSLKKHTELCFCSACFSAGPSLFWFQAMTAKPQQL
ncbi:hypothetical protein XENOCAPTIV_001709 [Xenoophorus captivus]|uniref:Uncharacterized protein n=1 Tax=Xenoophorus captivus TaxID=1517983 RepID=A0ABV0REV6_9TELE